MTSLRLPLLLLACAAPFHAQTFTVLHTFAYPDGSHADSTPIEVSPGLLFGSTLYGGTNNCGTLFSLTTSGVFTMLHSFGNGDGCGPAGKLVQASNGFIYGVTTVSTICYVFKADLAGNTTVLATIYEEGVPLTLSPLIEAVDGNLYGTVAAQTSYAYRISLNGTMTVLGSIPAALGRPGPVSLALDGNFYGQATGGVFRVTPAGTVSPIFTFTNPVGGGVIGSLVQANNGRLYGTRTGQTYGILYSLRPDGSDYTEQQLACNSLSSGVSAADDTRLYFESAFCGNQAAGQLYRFDPTSNTSEVIYEFGGQAFYPKTPSAAVLQATDGVLYGTTLKAVGGATATLYSFNLNLPKPIPVVVDFSPTSGLAGTSVLIHGSHFLAASSVTFNGVPAPYVEASADYLTATVPVGATTGPITVTTPNGSKPSEAIFTIP